MSNPEGPGENREISCANCIGACCIGDAVLPLKRGEAKQMIDAGTELNEITEEPWVGLNAGFRRKFYRRTGACANFDPTANACSIYDERPEACEEFEMGGKACRWIRVEMGVDLGMPGMPPPLPGDE